MADKNLSYSNIKEQFLKLYPIQFFTVFSSALSSFINGLITGRFLSAVEMVALGLIAPMSIMLGALSAIVSSGAGILCGRYMGRGEGDKINKVFSVSVIFLFFLGIGLTLVAYTFAPSLATLFGSNSETLTYTVNYIRGISIGVIPSLIVPCIMTFLQMSNKSNVSLIATLILAFFVTGFGLLNVTTIHLGIFGMGLATSLSQFLVLIILISYLIIKKNIVTLNPKAFNIKECLDIIKLGAPSSLATVLYSIRNIVINSTALEVGGVTAANALAILGSFGGFIDAFNISLGSTITMLVSVFIGEKDTKSIKNLVLVSIVVGEILAVFKQIILTGFGGLIATTFGGVGDVIVVAKALLTWYGISAFFNVVQLSINNTYAAQGRGGLCTVQLFLNCLIVPFTVLYISRSVGIGIAWTLYAAAEVVCLIMYYCVACVRNKKLVTNLDQMLYLYEGFETDGTTSITINRIEDVSNISINLQSFCQQHGIDDRRAKLTGLCVEEMAANIIENEFGKDNKENTIDIFASINDNDVSVRLRDNCVPFDPHSKLGMEGKDLTEDIGIKMVAKIAKEMNYQITFGMNILTIKL